MRLSKRHAAEIVEGDMTPMIDMAFQLIAFFMLVINFTDAEQDQRINLPASVLANPPEAPYEEPLTIHLTESGQFIFAGGLLPSLDDLHDALLRESQVISRNPDKKLADVTVIIRGDEDARTGQVQEIIAECQELRFEQFALRGKKAEAPTIRSP